MNSNFPSDPKAPLTSKELAILLMNNCMDRVLEERAHTKELINDKAETVVAGIVHGMRDGFATMSGIIKSQGESIANLELKCETYNTYLEQLMYRHVLDITPDLGTKPASFNCSVCVKNPSMPRDIAANLEDIDLPHFHCNSCLFVFTSGRDLYRHECNPHTNSVPIICWTCGKTFAGESELMVHLDTEHVRQSSFPCKFCNKVFKSATQLDEHSTCCRINVEATCACTECSNNFQSSGHLAMHQRPMHEEQTSAIICENLSSQPCKPYFLPIVSPNQDNQSARTEYNPCRLCGKVLSSLNEENHHMMTHMGSVPFTCTICYYTCQTKPMMELHVQTQHSPKPELHCNLCDYSSHNMRQLNVHIKEHQGENAPTENDHASSACPTNHDYLDQSSCLSSIYDCQIDGNITGDEEDITANEIEDTISDIGQLDGNLSISSDNADYSSPRVTNASSTQTAKNAPYTLNKDKQLSRLARNAAAPNFTIEVTHPTNVNIQCSSGFYQLVAKRVLSSLLEPNISVNNVPITCSDPVTSKIDQLRRNVNVVLHFKVGEDGQQESATVHLHHTQQKVQIQGVASPWFAETVLKPRFISEANNCELNIRALNTDLSSVAGKISLSENKTNPCGHCGKNFRANAKSTSTCKGCSQVFHHSKNNSCFLLHQCLSTPLPNGSASVSIASTTNTSASSLASIPHTSVPPSNFSSFSSLTLDNVRNTSSLGQNTVPMSGATSSTVSVLTSVSPSLPTISTTVPPLTSSFPTFQTTNTSMINSSAPEFISTKNVMNAGKKEAQKQSKDKKDLEIDFLKREINIVKTHLLTREAEVKELKQKNRVLEETVKLFENQQQADLTKKYSARDTTSSSLPASPSCSVHRPCTSTFSPQQSSHSVIEPSLVNKLLNLLTDILISQGFANNRDAQNCAASARNTQNYVDSASNTQNCVNSSSTTPVHKKPSTNHDNHDPPCSVSKEPDYSPTIANTNPVPGAARTRQGSCSPMSTASAASHSQRQSLNDSTITLDEFAAELSKESFSPSQSAPPQTLSLNCQVLTTQ